MSVIVPTVTADNPHTYREQIERVAGIANRIHIDTADGLLAPVKLITPERIWWPAGLRVDIHLMFQDPAQVLPVILAIHPDLVIIHAEATGNFFEMAREIRKAEAQVGLALLPRTDIMAIQPVLKELDHVLVFSGNLGYFGGTADLDLLAKVKYLRKLKPKLEIGWDGGINVQNAQQLAKGGIDVLNVGGAIQRSRNPRQAYHTLASRI